MLTTGDLAEYQALVEIDGPWWGEREAAYARRLCSLIAATGGADHAPDDFAITWSIGSAAEPEGNFLPPADGLVIFAARYKLRVEKRSQ